MPTLTLTPEVETTAPGLTRRRIWHAPAVRSHSLVALTLTKVYLAPPTEQVKQDTLKAIEGRSDLESVLGPLTTVIELGRVKRVLLDLVTNSIALDSVRSLQSGSGLLGLPVSRVVIEFATAETADEVFSKIWRRLGGRYELKRERSGWDLARVPLVFMAGILLSTLVLGLIANAAADTSGAGGLLKPFASADWRVLCAVGGAVLAGIQVGLYRRLTRPPSKLELGLKSV